MLTGTPPWSTGDRIVGRAGESAAIAAAAARAAGGRPQLVVVTGRSGIGKSVLVTHVLQRLPQFTVIRIAGAESETGSAYAALEQLAGVVAEYGLDTVPLLATGPPRRASSVAVGAELVRLLGDLQPSRPIALIVEDAQWVDTASSRALQFALRRLGVEPALLVVTTRGGTRPEDLTWVRSASEQGIGELVQLGPLSVEDVGELAQLVRGQALPPHSVRRLHGHTSGHPLHTRLLLDQLSWPQLVSTTGPLPVPRSLTDTVVAGLAELSAPARELVIAVAVTGGPLPLPTAAAISGVQAATAALEEAAGAGLLEELDAPDGRRLKIPHPLLAAAVVDGVPPRRRRAVHLAAAAHVHGDAALVHLSAAAEGPDEELAHALQEAGTARAAAGDPAVAAARFLAAAQVSGDMESRERRFLRGVGLLLYAGDVVRAAQLESDVRDCAPSPGRSGNLAVLTALAGRFAETGELVAEARALARERADWQVAAVADIVAATLDVSRGPTDGAAAAAVLANPAASKQLRGQARLFTLMADLTAGRIEQALASVADLPDDPGQIPVETMPLLAMRGFIRLWSGDERAALTDLRGVETAIGRGAGLTNFVPLTLAFLAQAELAAELWDDAARHAELAVAVATAEHRTLALPTVHAVAAQVFAERGPVAQAVEHLATCRTWTAVLPSPGNRVNAGLAGAVVARVQDDAAAMLDALAPLVEEDVQFLRAHRQLLYAEALAMAGRGREAEQVADSAAGDAAGWADDTVQLCAQLVHATAQLAAGETAEARRTLAALAPRMPAGRQFLQARVDLLHASVLLREGRSGAAAALTAAKTRFVLLGARPWVARCERLMPHASPGRTPRFETGAPSGLTEREHEVARLASVGLTNSEVAARLYVSHKAVEYHLTNVYAKLGISSRRQLAPHFATARIDAAAR